MHYGIATGQLKGTTTITASFDGDSDSANVSVYDPTESLSIEITPADPQLFIDGTQQFNAFAHLANNEIQNITSSALWLSSDYNVIAMATGVNSRNGFFIARSEGIANITAGHGINNVGTTTVTVKKVVLERITIAPQDATVTVAEIRSYFTEAVASDGNLISINSSTNQSYSVDEPSIAYISNNPDNKGHLTGLVPGTTIVHSTFEYEGIIFTAQTTVTVTP